MMTTEMQTASPKPKPKSKSKPDALTEFYRGLDRTELTRQGVDHLHGRADVRARRAVHIVRVAAWTVIIAALVLGAGFCGWLLLTAQHSGQSFNLENAVELVNPPDRLLLSIFSCLSWLPIWCPENADVVQLQGARCAGMAHAISSFVQRRRWAATAFFRFKAVREQVIRAYDEPGD